MKSKKGFEMTMPIIVSAALLLIVMTVLLVIFIRGMGDGTDEFQNSINNAKDKDGDNVVDLIDPCKGPNPPKEQQVDNPDCPGAGKWSMD
ncbi:MAG: hypothetical protein ACLFPQ_06390 [Candidatus Woesearchaeota archaeon]